MEYERCRQQRNSGPDRQLACARNSHAALREDTMKRALTLVAVVFVLTLTSGAQDLASSIVGVWKLTSHIVKEKGTGAIAKPFGEKPTGHWIFTHRGHFAWTLVGDNRKNPATPAVTDAEQIQLFKTLSFGSGTYKVEGDRVASRYETSWIETWTGTERKGQVQISGKTLMIMSATFKDFAGKDAVAISTWERAE